MNNKTCGDCCGFSGSENRCLLLGGRGKAYADNEACRRFVEKKTKVITNGDKIRQGGDDELIDFADGIRRRMCHYCVYSKDKSCVDKTGNCWEGVKAWLNAPAESEVKDD